MKTRNKVIKAGLAAVSVFGMAADSEAVLFQNIAPQELVFKFANFDEGSLYTPQPVGTEVGTTNNPAAGATQLDGITALQAANAQSISPFGNTLEDAWGIAFVTQIFSASDPVTPLWDATVDQQQLTVMFYGGQDFYLQQNANGALGSSQTINSVNYQFDFYLQNTTDPGFTSFNQLGGPAARTGAASYPTVTDGSLVLSAKSTAGFLRGVGSLGGPATEVEATFNGDALNGAGDGSAFLSVATTLGGTGSLNAAYNNNDFLAPHIVGNTADFQIQFTTTTLFSGDWLVSSNDPMRTRLQSTSVPEPATGLAAIGCLVPLVARRRKARIS
jgi:hypothetical protein